MPKVRWVMLYTFCSKFHMLSRSVKFLKIGQGLTKLQGLMIGVDVHYH